MKIYNILNKIALSALLVAGVSCTDDDLGGLEPLSKATVSSTVTSVTVTEGDTGVIPFTLSQAINKVSQFKIEIMSGTAVQADVAAGDQDTDADTGIPHEGFEITVPAFTDSFDVPVEALLDSDPCEATETMRLRISAAGVRTVLTEDAGHFVDVTILNNPLFAWTIDGVDVYGDGWNGASIDVTVDGLTTSYTVEEDHNVFTVFIPLDAVYSFAFTSGDWDGEIEYTITAPDGTVYADAYYPAVGVITSGTQATTCL